MFEIKINTGKNAILCVMKGRFDQDEAREYVTRFKDGLDKLQDEVVIITDISEFTPSDEDVRTILREGSSYADKKGVARGIRVVSDNVGSSISNIQFNRGAREIGYKTESVHSLDDAKRLLDW
jgi:hypothetical protein